MSSSTPSDSNNFFFSMLSKSSVDSTTNPKTNETLSEFGDGSCGEPLFTQHLLVDFTPNPVIDNDIVQKKICDFWECINNATHIQNLKVKAQKKSYARLSPRDCIELLKLGRENTDAEKTAVSMLELVNEEGLIDRTFETKLPQSVCSLGSREYKENVLETVKSDKKRRLTKPTVCSCTSICRPCPGLLKSGKSQESLSPVKTLCKSMEDWDAEHPKKTGTTDGTSNARSYEKFTVFSEGSCGEPFPTQHLTIDFTPNDAIDNDFVQRKICSFWQFIENTPEIHNLRIKPEVCQFDNASCSRVISKSETFKSEAEYSSRNTIQNSVAEVSAEKSAVDMLEVVGEKLIGRTLQTKLPQSHCTLNSREYKEMDTFAHKKKRDNHKPACHCTKICSSSCPNRRNKVGWASTKRLSPLKNLNETLKEWDAAHPKSMKPPGHPPALDHCILQRQTHEMKQMRQMNKVDLNKVELNKVELNKADSVRSSGEPMRPQHLVIDFTPGREDTPEIQAKCQEFWQFAHNQAELKGMKVKLPHELEHHAIVDFPSKKSSMSPDSFPHRNNIPAIHTMKKMEKKGVIKAALEGGQVNKSYI